MKDEVRGHSPNSDKNHKDFSDIVQGEDLEFRKSVKDNFPIKHRISGLNHIPTSTLERFTPNQLVMVAGAASGFLAGVVVCPLDVIKTRAQAQGAINNKKTKVMRGYFGVFKKILRDEGVRGLYRGLVPISIGYLPTWMIYFAVYEKAKRFYPEFFDHKIGMHPNSINHFFSAVTAGMASSIAVNPIWVVKTRLMIQTGKQHSTPGGNNTYYNGTLDAFKKMYKQEGFKVFYSGLIPSLFGLLHVGIHFPVYEALKDMLHCNIDSHNPKPEGLLTRLILASTFSKMTASTITYPHEILRTRLQMQSNEASAKTGLRQTIKSIYGNEGLRGFYAGYGINLMRTLPASAVTLVSFEYFKTYFLEVSGHNETRK